MRDKVILACTVCLNRNYSTDKNKSTQSERMEIRKYCKRCGTHTLHRQTK